MSQWIPAILALSALIIIHEYGHYFFARRTGMHVRRFSVFGIGPVLFRLFTYKSCEYVICAVPFGAYVQIAGMESEEAEEEMRQEAEGDGGSTPPDDPNAPPPAPKGYRNFRDSSFIARFLTLAGGPIFNYLAAIIIGVLLFLSAGMQAVSGAKVVSFGESSPLEEAGIRVDDQFLKIADTPIRGSQAVERVQEAGIEHLGERVEVVVMREDKEQIYCVKLNDISPALGVNIGAIATFEPVPPATAIIEGIKYPFVQSARQLKFLGEMITGKRKGNLGGPVGIVSAMANSAKDGLTSFLMISALISGLLGLFNLLPIPALDGGRLVFVIFNAISPKKIALRIEEQVHTWGLLALLLFMAYATVGDVGRLGASKTNWKGELSNIRARIIDAEVDARGGPRGCAADQDVN